MQYRRIIHGDIDAFLKLRKRFERKMRPTYTYATDNTLKDIENKKTRNSIDDTSLYMYKEVWQ